MTSLTEKTTGLLAFVRTVDAGSFSAAARSMGTTTSAISKSVRKLEDRLGVQLLHRTTRSIGLTQEGGVFYERTAAILRELDDAETMLQGSLSPRGLLRVSAPLDLGRMLIAPWCAEFLAQNTAVRVELQLTDRNIDLVTESVDLAIRLGPMNDSSLITTRLGRCPFVVCATPAYLARAGTPQSPNDLRDHNCIRYMTAGRPFFWTFETDGGWTTINVEGSFDSDDGGAITAAMAAGLGLAYVLKFQVASLLATGTVRQVLCNNKASDLGISAVFPSSRHVSPRVRAFITFLQEKLRAAGYR